MITESPSEYSANIALTPSQKLKPGHYLKRGNTVISKRYDDSDKALMAWRSLPSHKQAGVVVKHIKEEVAEVENEIIEEGHVESHIQQVLADRDINSEIKGGKLVVHRSNVAKAKYHVKKLGHTISIIGGLNESEAHIAIRDKLVGMDNLRTVRIPTPEERRAKIAQRKAEEEKQKQIKESEVLESAMFKLDQDEFDLSDLSLDELSAYVQCEEFSQLGEEVKEQLVDYISTLTK